MSEGLLHNAKVYLHLCYKRVLTRWNILRIRWLLNLWDSIKITITQNLN